MLFKTHYLILLILIQILNFSNTTRFKLKDDIAPQNTQSSSISIASTLQAATNLDTNSKATLGHISAGLSGADAKTNTFTLNNNIEAISDAGDQYKTVEAAAHLDANGAQTYGMKKDALEDKITFNQFETSDLIKTDLNDNVTRKSVVKDVKKEDTILTNSRQTITDLSNNIVQVQTETGSPNLLLESNSRDIVISLNSNKEKIIVEKIISRDDRVIVVTAAKYVFKGLLQSDKEYIQNLINGICNCKQVKNYLIELLAEAS